MSKMAKLNSRKYRRVKDATRFIVCEQAFDVRDGDLAIAVFHPESNTTFAFLCEDLPPKTSREYDMALRKAIWKEALKHIPSNKENREKAPDARMPMHQPALF